jgi:two-component system, OmpR family, sensor kinase
VRRLKLRRGHRARLRTRVLAGVLGVTLVALAGFDVAAVTALRRYLYGQTDTRLQAVLALYQPISQVAPSHVRPLSGPTPHVAKAPSGCQAPRLGHLCLAGPRFRYLPGALGPFLVGTVAGDHIAAGFLVKGGLSMTPLLPADIHALAVSGRAETVPSAGGGASVRLLARDIPGTGIVFAVTSLDELNATLGRLELILAIGSAAAGLVAAGGTAWLIRRGLRPVERMATQADKISAGDLDDRVSPHDARTEVGRLGTALNGMLDRIQSFVVERDASQQATARFFADASHELRTPLASLRANAELYEQGALPEPGQVDEAMRRIAAEARRMGGLVDGMLRLARLDQHPQRRHEPVDLTELAGECVQRARTAYPQLAWRTGIAPGLATTGDEELLRQAIDNLLANVAAHTPQGTTATITAAEAGGTVTVQVSDDGPGVPAGQLPCIFERFYRAGGSSSRTGSGLGLAIVAATATAHHGTAEAALNQPHGLRVTLTLPSASCARWDSAWDDAAATPEAGE